MDDFCVWALCVGLVWMDDFCVWALCVGLVWIDAFCVWVLCGWMAFVCTHKTYWPTQNLPIHTRPTHKTCQYTQDPHTHTQPSHKTCQYTQPHTQNLPIHTKLINPHKTYQSTQNLLVRTNATGLRYWLTLCFESTPLVVARVLCGYLTFVCGTCVDRLLLCVDGLFCVWVFCVDG
jgi:hypothetical protein